MTDRIPRMGQIYRESSTKVAWEIEDYRGGWVFLKSVKGKWALPIGTFNKMFSLAASRMAA